MHLAKCQCCMLSDGTEQAVRHCCGCWCCNTLHKCQIPKWLLMVGQHILMPNYGALWPQVGVCYRFRSARRLPPIPTAVVYNCCCAHVACNKCKLFVIYCMWRIRQPKLAARERWLGRTCGAWIKLRVSCGVWFNLPRVQIQNLLVAHIQVSNVSVDKAVQGRWVLHYKRQHLSNSV